MRGHTLGTENLDRVGHPIAGVLRGGRASGDKNARVPRDKQRYRLARKTSMTSSRVRAW